MRDGFVAAGLLLVVWLAAFGAGTLLLALANWPSCG